MRYLLEIVGARTQAELLNFVAERIGQDDELPSEATTKRWFSGATFPKAASVKPLALAVARASSATHAEAELTLMFWCARRANAALALAELVHARFGAPVVLGAEDEHSWAEDALSRWMTRWQTTKVSESSRTI